MAIPASIIDYLDKHAGAFTAILTAVLILVTAYYAIQNHRIVTEMRRTRNAAILPRLALEFHRLGPVVVTVAIKNVGPGAAHAIDVRLIYEARDPGHPSVERRWRHNVLSSGEQYDFTPPGELKGNIDTLPATYQAIRLRGSMRDATGAIYEVDEAFDDLPEWRDVLHDTHVRWVAATPERRLAEELAKKIDPAATKLERNLDAIARAISALREQATDDDE
jgi:hypothetical protein